MNISLKPKLIKITFTTEIKWKRFKGREMQTQGQHSMYYQRGNRNPRCKTSSAPSKW